MTRPSKKRKREPRHPRPASSGSHGGNSPSSVADTPEIIPYLEVHADLFLETLFRIESEKHWQHFQEWCNKHQSLDSTLSDRKWLFRGVGSKAYPLIPSAFRISPHDPAREKYIFDEFIRQACSYYPDIQSKTCVERLAIAQHHGLPTRLLDWSSNPYVAAFFACSGEKDAFAPAQIAAIKADLNAAPGGDVLAEDVANRKNGKKGVTFIKTPIAFPRIERQEGYFSLHDSPDSVLAPSEDEKFEIPAYAKPYFIRNLRNYGITDKSLMADLNGVSLTLTRDYFTQSPNAREALLVSDLGNRTIALINQELPRTAPVFHSSYTVSSLSTQRADDMEVILAGMGKAFSVRLLAPGAPTPTVEGRLNSLGEKGRVVRSYLGCTGHFFARFIVRVNQQQRSTSTTEQTLHLNFELQPEIHKAVQLILSKTKTFGSAFIFIDAPEFDFDNDSLILIVREVRAQPEQPTPRIRIVLSGVCSRHPGGIAVADIPAHLASLADAPCTLPD